MSLRSVACRASPAPTRTWSGIRRTLPVAGVLIVRPDAQIYYANALAVRDRVKALIAEAEPPVRAVILDASAQDEIDITSTDVLIGLIKALRARGIEWYVADVHAPVLERGRETGLLDAIGPEYVFPTLDAAVQHAEKSGGNLTAATIKARARMPCVRTCCADQGGTRDDRQRSDGSTPADLRRRNEGNHHDTGRGYAAP